MEAQQGCCPKTSLESVSNTSWYLKGILEKIHENYLIATCYSEKYNTQENPMGSEYLITNNFLTDPAKTGHKMKEHWNDNFLMGRMCAWG